MNRILAYTVVAILLGTVTMVAPLVLLGPNDQIPSEQYTIKATNGGEENQTTSLEVEGTFDRSDIVVLIDIGQCLQRRIELGVETVVDASLQIQ